MHIRLADCFIIIKIPTDHGYNYIANQLFVSTQANNAPWFGRNDIDVNESKMRSFCFITQQNHITWMLSSSGQPDSDLSSWFLHTPLFWCQRWCISNNWNSQDTNIAIVNCFLMLILLRNGYRLFCSIIPALLIPASVHQNRWSLLLRTWINLFCGLWLYLLVKEMLQCFVGSGP